MQQLYAEVAVSGFTHGLYQVWLHMGLYQAAPRPFSGSCCLAHMGLLGGCGTRAFFRVQLHMGLTLGLAALRDFCWAGRSLLCGFGGWGR